MFSALRGLRPAWARRAKERGSASSAADARLAVCALLLEVARADSELTSEERVYMERAVRRHYGLGQRGARKLLGRAEALRCRMPDIAPLTRMVAARYSPSQIAVLTRVMWELIHCDGRFGSEERYLMRKIYGLLRLEAAWAG